MKVCPNCHNYSQDDAMACSQCGTLLDQSKIPRAGGATRPRTPTMAEPFEAMPTAPPPPRIEYRPTPPAARPGMPPAAVTIPAAAPAAPAATTTAGRRGQTVYLPQTGGPEATGVQAAPYAAGRRVLAVLVTYSWKPEGQVFPIREGRNLIGRGLDCDVSVPEDPMLSASNSHITYRQNFTIGDMVSMGGTFMDGQAIEEQFRPLANLAQIRAGSTQFVFVIVDPALLGKDD